MTPLSISSTAPFFLAPKAFARKNKSTQAPPPNGSSTRRSQKKKYEPPLRHMHGGGAATSYTSLPPLQDFSSSSPTVSSREQEVKLSDSAAAVQKKANEDVKRYNFVEQFEEGRDDSEEEVDYGRYELFIVGSEGEDDDEDYPEREEDDDEDDAQGEEEEWTTFSDDANYTVGEVFEPGSYLDSDDEEYDDDGVDEDDKVDYRVDDVFEAGVEDDSELDEDEYDDEMVNYRVGEVFEPVRKVKNLATDDSDLNEKEKGVPAVMRCFDKTKIYVKAGDGGNGVVAFRREKFVPLGGPSGGNGGRGGNVYLEVDAAMNSLLSFRNKIHYRAERGSHGQGSMMDGAKGEDVIIKVAPGTVIRESGKENVLLELMLPGQRALLLPGGRGGRGNAAFKCSGNKAPKIAENGEEGHEMWLDLELKLVADVGIVGAPNAGKSTLLSVISAAKPEIANYPFTTLLPNLGVVSFDYDSTMVVADLPGLLEGAHRGFGLGHEFLRHTERCSSLVHVVDGSSPQPELEFDAVRLELELFSPEIAEKPFIVAFNKMDLPEARENWPSFSEKLQARGIQTFCMSAVERENTHEVICAAHNLLQKSRAGDEEIRGLKLPENLNHVADKLQKDRRSPINEFEISYDSGSSTWNVNGSGLRRFIQMTNWKYVDSERRFQHVLEACGVNKSLVKMGVKEGDTVIVGEMELVWHDSLPSYMKNNGSAKWPELK